MLFQEVIHINAVIKGSYTGKYIESFYLTECFSFRKWTEVGTVFFFYKIIVLDIDKSGHDDFVGTVDIICIRLSDMNGLYDIVFYL